MDEPDATMVEFRSTSRSALERLPVETGVGRPTECDDARSAAPAPRPENRARERAGDSALGCCRLVWPGTFTRAGGRADRARPTTVRRSSRRSFPRPAISRCDEPFDIVTRSTLTLPAGDYRMRLTAPGRLGRTYRFAVNRGELLAQPLSIDEGLLLGGERSPAMGTLGQRSPRSDPVSTARWRPSS